MKDTATLPASLEPAPTASSPAGEDLFDVQHLSGGATQLVVHGAPRPECHLAISAPAPCFLFASITSEDPPFAVARAVKLCLSILSTTSCRREHANSMRRRHIYEDDIVMMLPAPADCSCRVEHDKRMRRALVSLCRFVARRQRRKAPAVTSQKTFPMCANAFYATAEMPASCRSRANRQSFL
jgi:hypothetical protein